jgi:AraC family carnitine catabolism transcriptional activator
VIEVGLACGFASASAFSRAYRREHAVAPKDDRKEKPHK